MTIFFTTVIVIKEGYNLQCNNIVTYLKILYLNKVPIDIDIKIFNLIKHPNFKHKPNNFGI